MNEDNNNNNNPTTLPYFSDDIDSCSSTPFVSAPSSPGRDLPISTGFYFSAPSSPMHYILSTSSLKSYSSTSDASFEFDLPSSGAASADELFFNGQIRPVKLSSHLQRPQVLDPLIEDYEEVGQMCNRGREIKLRAGSLRRRTRSMSPLRNFVDQDEDDSIVKNVQGVNVEDELEVEEERNGNETTPRSSSAGRNSSSKRWVFLKEFLYRSKSEGRNHDGHNKFWGFSPSSSKDKDKLSIKGSKKKDKESSHSSRSEEVKRKVLNGNRVGKRNSVPSAHEMHYTAKRAQAEEMRKRTFLPYRQGLLGCLGFSSKSFGAMNGFAKVLNPTVSSS